MKIQLNQIKVRDLFEGYVDNGEEGVYGYSGKLSIRPPYQREFVYDDKKRRAVIDTVRANFPLNVMYWVKCNDGSYELMDGQQRTVSICQYLRGEFADNKYQYFKGLQPDERENILNYELQVYICEGTDSEKLSWFNVINTAGEEMTDQELRNATYVGTWLTDAKRKFSKTGCLAYRTGQDYMSGSPIRQDYLETVIKWRSKGNVNQYMADHQFDPDANDLWVYFQNIMNWIKMVFPNYRKEMKGLDWGRLYDTYHDKVYNADELESEIKRLMMDDDVTKRSGVYEYLLSEGENEKVLSVRAFSENMKRKKYEEQKGICPVCGKHHEYKEMEGDHIIAWKDGGKTEYNNLQMLCKHCNRTKSGK